MELEVKVSMPSDGGITEANRRTFARKVLEGYTVKVVEQPPWDDGVLKFCFDDVETTSGFHPESKAKSKARRAKRFKRSNVLKDKNKHGWPNGRGLAGRENLSYGTKNDRFFKRKMERDFAREGGIAMAIYEGLYEAKRGQYLRYLEEEMEEMKTEAMDAEKAYDKVVTIAREAEEKLEVALEKYEKASETYGEIMRIKEANRLKMENAMNRLNLAEEEVYKGF